MKISNNVTYLTTEEKEYLNNCSWYTFVYDVGLIFLPDGGSWDCSNSVAAKQYLDKLGIKEKHK